MVPNPLASAVLWELVMAWGFDWYSLPATDRLRTCRQTC